MHSLAIFSNSRTGKGDVTVSKVNGTIIFHEKGTWSNDGIAFKNTLRWTLKDQLIGLERSAFGSYTLLFDLACSRPGTLESIKPHLCGQDSYTGKIVWGSDSIQFECRVKGPHKNDVIARTFF